jgi:TonB family protein
MNKANIFAAVIPIYISLLTLPSHADDSIKPIPSRLSPSNYRAADANFPVPVIAKQNFQKLTESSDNSNQNPLKNFCKNLDARIYSNWETNEIGRDRNLKVSFTLNCDGSFEKIKILNPSGNAQVDFNCVEAIRESSRFKLRIPELIPTPSTITIDFRKDRASNEYNCAENFFSTSKVTSDSIVYHLIPLDALNCVNGLKPSVVHSSEFLREVAVTPQNLKGLEDATMEWTDFLRSNTDLTLPKIISEAKKINLKYSFLFGRSGRIAPTTPRP